MLANISSAETELVLATGIDPNRLLKSQNGPKYDCATPLSRFGMASAEIIKHTHNPHPQNCTARGTINSRRTAADSEVTRPPDKDNVSSVLNYRTLLTAEKASISTERDVLLPLSGRDSPRQNAIPAKYTAHRTSAELRSHCLSTSQK